MVRSACVKWFTYDALDRLTGVSYGMDSETESFTYDDLGNRDSVTLRDTTTDDYVIDANNNRYISVDGNSLAYNAAGDLVTDKDDYDFEYDYENRITKIEDVNSVTVAQFAYDALGRRIKKIDSKASETTLYYHNNNWQVLAETNSGGTTQRWYIYGNYIDEPLRITDANSNSYYYVHDHLYSPAALVDSSGSVVERYEYDVYGSCRVLDPNFSDDADGLSDYDNPYQFTGRHVDILDNGNLKLQYNRNRYYDQYTGRWLTHDPLGIVPNAQRPNRFDPFGQYADGGNLYEYVNSNLSVEVDSHGLWGKWVHYNMTRLWAFDIGYEYGVCAEIIAKSCNNVDSVFGGRGPFPRFGDFRYHFDTDKSGNIEMPGMRAFITELHTVRAYAALWSPDISYGDVEKGLEDVGIGLHPLQDTYSHSPKHSAQTPRHHAPWYYCTLPSSWFGWEKDRDWCEKQKNTPNWKNAQLPDDHNYWYADYWIHTQAATKGYLKRFLDYPCVCARCKKGMRW